MINIGTIGVQIPSFITEGDAACAEVDPELFFPIGIEDLSRNAVAVYRDFKTAKAICDGCDLKMRCLEYAIKNHEYGIWGGTTEVQRSHLRRRITTTIKKRQLS